MLITHAELLSQIGSSNTKDILTRLVNFVYVPQITIDGLKRVALQENWGRGDYVLRKYLAVHLFWAIEQQQYTMSDTQLYVSAGSLQTRYGTPLFLVLEPNQFAGSPWRIVHSGSFISAPELPTPPVIPQPAGIDLGLEIVIMHDHILEENASRVEFLRSTPPVAQMCAVAGAIQWSLNRGIQFPYWYFGRMSYLVPLYLTSREDITRAPDLVAPIQVNANDLLVRTVLEPYMPYANARVAVRRHDQLPHWLIDGWSDYAEHETGERDDLLLESHLATGTIAGEHAANARSSS